MRKKLTKNVWNIEVWAVQKHVNLVDLVKSFPTNIYLQNLARPCLLDCLLRYSRERAASSCEGSGVSGLWPGLCSLSEGPGVKLHCRKVDSLTWKQEKNRKWEKSSVRLEKLCPSWKPRSAAGNKVLAWVMKSRSRVLQAYVAATSLLGWATILAYRRRLMTVPAPVCWLRTQMNNNEY